MGLLSNLESLVTGEMLDSRLSELVSALKILGEAQTRLAEVEEIRLKLQLMKENTTGEIVLAEFERWHAHVADSKVDFETPGGELEVPGHAYSAKVGDARVKAAEMGLPIGPGDDPEVVFSEFDNDPEKGNAS